MQQQFVLLIVQDATLAGQPGERASPDSREGGNKKTGYWHCEKLCDTQQHFPSVCVQAALSHCLVYFHFQN